MIRNWTIVGCAFAILLQVIIAKIAFDEKERERSEFVLMFNDLHRRIVNLNERLEACENNRSRDEDH